MQDAPNKAQALVFSEKIRCMLEIISLINHEKNVITHYSWIISKV
jgi:hypothetical protein